MSDQHEEKRAGSLIAQEIKEAKETLAYWKDQQKAANLEVALHEAKVDGLVKIRNIMVRIIGDRKNA